MTRSWVRFPSPAHKVSNTNSHRDRGFTLKNRNYDFSCVPCLPAGRDSPPAAQKSIRIFAPEIRQDFCGLKFPQDFCTENSVKNFKCLHLHQKIFMGIPNFPTKKASTYLDA